MKKKIFAIVLCLIMAVPIFLLAGTDNVTQVAI